MAQPSLKPTGLRELRRADGAYAHVERALRLALGLPGPGQSHVGFKDAKRVPATMLDQRYFVGRTDGLRTASGEGNCW